MLMYTQFGLEFHADRSTRVATNPMYKRNSSANKRQDVTVVETLLRAMDVIFIIKSIREIVIQYTKQTVRTYNAPRRWLR